MLNRFSESHESITDFGSFPFAIPLSVRDYFGHNGPITSTLIQEIQESEKDILEKYDISLDRVDLDPYVVDFERKSPKSLPRNLKTQNQSQDVVSMFHVIEHLYHPMSALKEAARILKKSGRIIITTDNAMMLNTLQNYVSGYGYIFEPVRETAAMTVHDWRGHVRFFTYNDLVTMLDASGFDVIEYGFNEIFYNILYDEHFAEPRPFLPNFKKDILKKYPQFSNDVWIVGAKR